MSESFFHKVTGLKGCNFIEKRLQHRCFSVKFTKCLRAPIFNNICEQLLLKLSTNKKNFTLQKHSCQKYMKYINCFPELFFISKLKKIQLQSRKKFHSYILANKNFHRFFANFSATGFVS